MSNTRPSRARPAGQRETEVIDGRCQAAANGTRRTGTARRPRNHRTAGMSRRAASQRGEWRVRLFTERGDVSARPHAGVEIFHEGVEAVFVGADGEAAEGVGEKVAPGGV